MNPAAYAQIDHRLRSLLFGDGDTTSGLVRGEDNRLAVSAELNRMQEWRKNLQNENYELQLTIKLLQAKADEKVREWVMPVPRLEQTPPDVWPDEPKAGA